ncbi:MAG: hypothetical protein RIS70_4163 [Planctomycetota bacterium]|jgi:hypothetical protein
MDNPIVGNQLRFRYDSNYDATQPARAEFIWPDGGKRELGPGPETRIDYQDLWLYGEAKMAERWSLFGELPVRFANPEIQDNTAGFGDGKHRLQLRTPSMRMRCKDVSVAVVCSHR